MLHSDPSPALPSPYEADHLTTRRVRHIIAIQIRNLTPFPVRDAFTTALSQPAEHSHFSGASDDLGTIFARKRSRKISTNSSATRRSLKWDDSIPDSSSPVREDVRRRTVSASRITAPGPSTSPNQLGQSYMSARSNHSLRSHRGRTNSVISANSTSVSIASLPSSAIASNSSYIHPENTQTSLEKVVGSRLVETFITITVPEIKQVPASSVSPLFQPMTRTTSTPKSASMTKYQVTRTPSHSSSGSTKTQSPVKESTRKSVLPSSTPSGIGKVMVKAGSSKDAFGITSNRVNGTSTPKKSKPANSLTVDPPPPVTPKPLSPPYVSPIHRPSTNPTFPIDARSGWGFSDLADINGHQLGIEIWGRVSLFQSSDVGLESDFDKEGWKVLNSWNLDLRKLVPLPDELAMNSSLLPSNALTVTLSPPGRTYYLPQPSTSRVVLRATGYSSDPESEIRKTKTDEDPSSSAEPTLQGELANLSRRRRRGDLSEPTRITRTVGWQELFKLVTLQSLILDNEASLSDVETKIDGLLKEDAMSPLRREVSEREARIRELQDNRDAVLEHSGRAKVEITDRSDKLRQRWVSLELARTSLFSEDSFSEEISKARKRLEQLERSIISTRTSLISTLSFIFPIELLSPPELLFTILDIPLPIPLSLNDPAPPLSLPDFKDVSEESVATALGYVTQVLHVLAAYMGKLLVYPVTCCGSRSLVRDGISSMVGPRMFPLFSKGVDTYRFEYGVFLLNKNIEMLMSERELRALDIRHTLPNLKNLLLTLSHESSVAVEHAPRVLSPDISLSGLETPSRSGSPVGEETPKVSHRREHSGDATTPTASGATTPTLREESRKGKVFLGFVALPEFLRARYPSVNHGDSEDEEGDELTIHGQDVDSLRVIQKID